MIVCGALLAVMDTGNTPLIVTPKPVVGDGVGGIVVVWFPQSVKVKTTAAATASRSRRRDTNAVRDPTECLEVSEKSYPIPGLLES